MYPIHRFYRAARFALLSFDMAEKDWEDEATRTYVYGDLPETGVILNLGCGRQPLVGQSPRQQVINQDLVKHLSAVDIAFDLNVRPWPWEDGSADVVIMADLLEHLDDVVKTIEEVWRILRSDGQLRLRVPHYLSPDAFADPTHRHFFAEITFDYFDPSTPRGRDYSFYTHAQFRVRRRKVEGSNLIFVLEKIDGAAGRS